MKKPLARSGVTLHGIPAAFAARAGDLWRAATAPSVVLSVPAIIALAALLVAFVSAAQPQARPEQDALFRDLDKTLSEVSDILGLKVLRPVPHQLIGRSQVKQFLEERIRTEMKPEELRAEELTLKKFGLVPPDFDLKKVTVDLLTEQAAAFYDYGKKRLYILDSPSEELQQAALAHELAHALADQHFNLDKYISRGLENDDGSMARLAVMEGQATWVMAEYMARQMNMSLRTSPAIVSYMGTQMGATASQFPVFEKAPLYLQQSLLFPYTKGMLFQNAVVEKEGLAAFRRVFEKPPASTQQIIHPEKYFAGEPPAVPPVPRIPSQGDYRSLSTGQIGEFDFDILLRQYAGGEAAAAATRWRGGEYRLFEHKKNGSLVLVHVSQWADSESASEFFALYRKVLAGKWKNMDVATADAAHLAGRGDDGFFDVRLAGSRVTAFEGLPSVLP
jgi:hypothetical protein